MSNTNIKGEEKFQQNDKGKSVENIEENSNKIEKNPIDKDTLLENAIKDLQITENTNNEKEKKEDKFGESTSLDYDIKTKRGELAVKVICLGDSAVGKSKLLERFLEDGYQHQQLSTFALTLYRYRTEIDGQAVLVDFWDTAGQERFQTMHASYYHQAHAAILVFDGTRKITYKNLSTWYQELRENRPEIPTLCAVNKIDENEEIAGKTFAFPEKNNMPLHYVSASRGTNVVKLFKDAISAAIKYKKNPTDFTDEVLAELEMDNEDGED